MAQYTEDDVAAAIQDVRNGKPIRRAAKDWGVPKTTLIDRLSGRESSREAAISQQRLSPVQEKHLTDWVLTQEALGLAPTHAQIKELAERVLALKGGHTPLGKNWIAAFFRRNPILRTKRQRRIDSQRINGASTEVIRSWFPKLRIPAIQAIKPENRYNMDEHGIMEGQGGNGLVVGSAAIRAIHQKQPGSRAWTSILECISATGRAISPLVIYKGKTIQQQWFPSDLRQFKEWHFAATKKGWTEDSIAVEWLEKVFLPYTDTTEPRLLILDGHGSHTTTDFMSLCHQNNVHLLFLPPHSSHVLQPLDVGVFAAMKAYYRKEIGFLALLTDSAPIGKRNFLISYQRARGKALSSQNIQSGWRSSGLWPVCVARPLTSPLLLENSNQTPKQPAEEVNYDMTGPSDIQTPPNASMAGIFVWSTPKKSIDLQRQLRGFHQLQQTDLPTQRQLFRKIQKGFDEKDYLIMDAELRIQALETKLDLSKPRKRKRVELSPNSKFATIEDIQKTEETINEALIGESDSDTSSISTAALDCIIVQE